MRESSQGDRVRGDFLLSPVFLAPLIVLLVNDLYWKLNHPGVVSGILSDLAGMVFFPIFLVGIAEILARFLPGKPYARPSWFVISTLVIAGLFVGMKYTAIGESVFVTVTGFLRPVVGDFLGYGQRGLVADPLDLIALVLAPIPVLFGYRVRGRSGTGLTRPVADNLDQA